MLIRFLVGIMLSLCAWRVGKEYSDHLVEEIRKIDEYILFNEELYSAVAYSGKSIRAVVEENKRYENFLKDKNEYGKMMSQILQRAETCSDAQCVAQMLKDACEKLKNIKRRTEEEYRGKIKTAPAIGLLAGIFFAVLLI